MKYKCRQCGRDKTLAQLSIVGRYHEGCWEGHVCKTCRGREMARMQINDIDCARRRRDFRAATGRGAGDSKSLTKRHALMRAATPAWADSDAIRAVYKECSVIREKTGIEHHVDHIIPLQHENVCGLHVSWNLQIIPAVENLQKSNKL